MKRDEIVALVRYRMDQADTALVDAQYLIDGNKGVASIVNRSYYAMYYAALGLLQTIGKTPSKHAGVLNLFNTEFILSNQLPRSLGRDIHEVFELRLKMDYRALIVLEPKQACATYEKAKAYVEAVKQYLIQHGWL